MHLHSIRRPSMRPVLKGRSTCVGSIPWRPPPSPASSQTIAQPSPRWWPCATSSTPGCAGCQPGYDVCLRGLCCRPPVGSLTPPGSAALAARSTVIRCRFSRACSLLHLISRRAILSGQPTEGVLVSPRYCGRWRAGRAAAAAQRRRHKTFFRKPLTTKSPKAPS